MKISRAEFGYGGYQDAMVGVDFTFSSPGCGCGDFWGTWAIERSEHAKWTEQSRIDTLGGVVMRLAKILDQAKKRHVGELVGVPVEVTFEGNALKSWRVLTEVI